MLSLGQQPQNALQIVVGAAPTLAAKKQHNEPANPKLSWRAVPNPNDLDPCVDQTDDKGIHDCGPADAWLARESDKAFTFKNGCSQALKNGGARCGEYRAPLDTSKSASLVPRIKGGERRVHRIATHWLTGSDHVPRN
jgi:hypothetical protein